MQVTKIINVTTPGIPDYYDLYTKWWSVAVRTGKNFALQEAYRFARLAEEFGQAIIEDDETHEDFLPE